MHNHNLIITGAVIMVGGFAIAALIPSGAVASGGGIACAVALRLGGAAIILQV